MSAGKGKGGGAGKRKGVKKEDRIFDDVLTSQLEEIMMENDKFLAKKYHNPGTTQAQKSKFWEQVRRRLSSLSRIDMEDPKFPDVAQIRKKWNYRVTKMREKSDKHKLEVRMQILKVV